MDKETQELNEKLAKWAGFEFDGDFWKSPDRSDIYLTLSNFTTDLNACFKWLVPKLEKSLQLQILFNRLHGNLWACVLTTYKGDIALAEARYKEPALALCRAIEKVIDASK